MSSMTMNQKIFRPIPPDKGSFPIDHEGLCRNIMRKYQLCLIGSESTSAPCRDLAKEYLKCRMDNNLMAQEEMPKLGFKDES